MDEWLDGLERRAFTYFVREINPDTGLVRDNSRAGAPSNVAGSGFALAAYVVGAERGYFSREEAIARTILALRFLLRAPQSDTPDATGFHGFFYHFLSLESGARVWDCELSTIDTTLALAGILTAGVYFERKTAAEREIRALANAIYERVDWRWMLDEDGTVCMGWHPESGFLPYEWQGYSEALLLHVLALGSPAHPLPASSYRAWTGGFKWKRIYGYDFLYAGPLFIHHVSQCWLDCRGIQDDFMRAHGIDYFENSRRAVYVQREYGRRNPRRWKGYSENAWGVTASDGPGPATRVQDGRTRRFYGYHARGVPYGPDDGTLSPWAVIASLPFAPEIVLPSIKATEAACPDANDPEGNSGCYNQTFPAAGRRTGTAAPIDDAWWSPARYAINQGPVVLMLENYRSGLLWRLMRQCPSVVRGLRRAGFHGGWLESC